MFLLLCSNELNAAYAADGYARVKQCSLGVLVTTYVLQFFDECNICSKYALGLVSANCLR